MEKPHRKLNVWKQSMDLTVQAYQATGAFPREELYGLTGQVRRSAVSVPSNIAEGAARQTKKEFANFLHISQGSLSELDTLLEVSFRLGFIDQPSINKLDASMIEIDKMLSGLIRKQRA